MSEMIERVAVAMFNRPGWDNLEEEVLFDGCLMPSKRWWRACARFAIMAMREPTIDMIVAADDKDGNSSRDDNASGYTHWQAMIDAALT